MTGKAWSGWTAMTWTILKVMKYGICALWCVACGLYLLHLALFSLYWAYRIILRGDDPRYGTRAIFGSDWRFKPNQGTDWIEVIAKKIWRKR